MSTTRTPLPDVIAWMGANPSATISDAARAHAWKPDSLSKALRRRAASATELVRPTAAPGQDGRTGVGRVEHDVEFKVLARTTIKQLLESLANPAWIATASPTERASILRMMVKEFGGLALVEKDEDAGDQAGEASRIDRLLPPLPAVADAPDVDELDPLALPLEGVG